MPLDLPIKYACAKCKAIGRCSLKKFSKPCMSCGGKRIERIVRKGKS
jgi:hypothetical protein